MFIPGQTSNEIVVLREPNEIFARWPFFLEGMLALGDPRRANAKYTPENFFNMLIKVVQMGRAGLVAVLESKNGKPLGFGVGYTAVDFNEETCFYVREAYTNSKCTTTLNELLHYTESYARGLGHQCIKMSTPRINGAALRLFEEKLGFKRAHISFRKDL